MPDSVLIPAPEKARTESLADRREAARRSFSDDGAAPGSGSDAESLGDLEGIVHHPDGSLG